MPQTAAPTLPPRAEAALATIQRLDAEVTARVERLEQRLVELAETTISQEQTLQQQQQQLTQVQEESARSAEEVARRSEQEEVLSARLAEEQTRSAQLAAELAEQHRQQEEALAKTQGTYNALIADLQKEIANKDVIIREANNKLAINIVDHVLFPSGQATLTTEGTQVLDKVGRVLQTVTDHRIQIEGHTDNQEIGPVLKKTFASNWELSTARATEVVKYFLAHSQLSAERLVAVGRADTVPVAPNTTEEGRQQNRRIEILLLPPEQVGLRGEGATERQG
jgi:chemotaxis protein MotB